MVHALDEIRRVLTPEGLLIDLRPLATEWPVEVAWGNESVEAGRLIDLPEAVANDEAANRAVEEMAKRGWFRLEKEEGFPYFYYWDTPSEMKEFLDTEWEAFEKLEESVLRATQSTWAVAEADARVRVRVRMMGASWRRTG